MYTPVGCELESALTDIVLGELHGVALVLDEVLDLPAAVDQQRYTKDDADPTDNHEKTHRTNMETRRETYKCTHLLAVSLRAR